MLRDVLLLQKRELEARFKEPYIARAADHKKLASPLIKVIIGPRRAGKSFFAVHFLKGQGNFGYVNFDDERLIGLKDYDELIVAVDSVYGSPKALLLDEVQNLPGWELFVNRLQRQGYDLVITGSNSKLLSRELATHLTGRHLLVYIFPFSFKEYLGTGKRELTTSEIKGKLGSYVTYGGYPEPLIKGLDYKDYLSTLFNSILYKDIVRRYKVRFAQGVENLALYLLSNIASECSYNSLSRVAGVKSSHTVEKYLGYLEESFIFFSLSRFSFKVKEQVSANKKVYCIDNGFIHSSAFRASPGTGKLYENIVANELRRDELGGRVSAYYWKGAQQEEVDFVLKEDLKVKQLIQVCFDPASPGARQRELRALLKAGRELKCKDLLVITDDYDSVELVEWFGMKGEVRFVPLWKWLLERGQ